jgi:branched-chain amino acid aminotransferase
MLLLNTDYSKVKPASKRRREQFRPKEILPFGKLRSDHMFLMNYSDGEWHSPRIVPYEEGIRLPFGAMVFHYAQEVFEGAKVFKHDDGELYMFRFDENAKRLNHSAEILCMPKIPEEIQIQALEELVDLERLWYPDGQEGASLYVRPAMFAIEDQWGVRPSNEYIFGIALSPSGPYYPGGLKPIKLLLSRRYHRALPIIGSAKAGGNYAASLRAIEYAKSLGAKQVLFGDLKGRDIEETGAMNHFHVIDNKVVIPTFVDSILESITAKSILELAKGGRFDFEVVQDVVRYYEFLSGIINKRITEAGGLGTAAVVSSVGRYVLDNGDEYVVGNGDVGELTRKMYDTLTGIQYGRLEAPKGWLRRIERR